MECTWEKKFPLCSQDYKLYEEVGEGGSAKVYRALCVPFNEIVAVKVFDLEKCKNDLVRVLLCSLSVGPTVLYLLIMFDLTHPLIH